MKKLFKLMLLSTVLAVAGTVNYSYDAAGRLVKIDYGSGGSITYTYDNAGNLLGRTVVPAGQTAGATKGKVAQQKKKGPAAAAPSGEASSRR